MKIEIQISPICTCPQCSTKKYQETFPANACKRREENTKRRYSNGLRNQNGEHIVNICELNILETLAKTLFPVESSYK